LTPNDYPIPHSLRKKVLDMYPLLSEEQVDATVYALCMIGLCVIKLQEDGNATKDSDPE
jgi:hypothetical protein